jgi:serine/threonine protein kinase
MALAPGTRLGVYEIVGLIGAGGMGEVYRARDTKLSRGIARKILTVSAAVRGAVQVRARNMTLNGNRIVTTIGAV